MFKKILAAILTCTLCASVFSTSLPAYAEDVTVNSSAEAADTQKEYDEQSGLTYTLLENGTYSVSDYDDSDRHVHVVIPSKFNGKYVASIGSWAFEGSHNLKSVEIPSSVTTIEEYAFYACTSVTSITLPNSLKKIGDSAFSSCDNLTDITIPNSVTEIGRYAFYYCTSLNSLTIPDSVTKIDNAAFSECSSLKSITLPDSVKEIGWEAFEKCTSLESIVIPEGVTDISSAAFSYCTSLKNVKLPNSLKTIDDLAFRVCTSLSDITIPDSVEYIGAAAFLNTPWLLNYPGDFVIVGSGVLHKYKGSNQDITVPDNVRSVSPYAFSVDLFKGSGPDSLLNYTPPKSVVFPKSVKKLEYGAFANCAELTSVTILNPNTEIVRNAIPQSTIRQEAIHPTIYGYKNSTAEQYAKEMDFPFAEITDDTPKSTPKPTKTLFHGNIDGDEKITAADSLLVLRASVKLENLTDEQKYFADVNGDGKVDSVDSLHILRYSVGLYDTGVTIGLKN